MGALLPRSGFEPLQHARLLGGRRNRDWCFERPRQIAQLIGSKSFRVANLNLGWPVSIVKLKSLRSALVRVSAVNNLDFRQQMARWHGRQGFDLRSNVCRSLPCKNRNLGSALPFAQCGRHVSSQCLISGQRCRLTSGVPRCQLSRPLGLPLTLRHPSVRAAQEAFAADGLRRATLPQLQRLRLDDQPAGVLLSRARECRLGCHQAGLRMLERFRTYCARSWPTFSRWKSSIRDISSAAVASLVAEAAARCNSSCKYAASSTTR